MPLGPPAAVEATIADIEGCRLSDLERSAVYANNVASLLAIGSEVTRQRNR
jgi:hypothetical protein